MHDASALCLWQARPVKQSDKSVEGSKSIRVSTLTGSDLQQKCEKCCFLLCDYPINLIDINDIFIL